MLDPLQVILIMWYRKYSLIFLFLPIVLLMGCGTKLSDLLSESLSENYMLAAYGTEASHPELNDGDLKTWGITRPPKRDYTVIFPEERKIDRIVVYSGNVLGYQLLCWDSEVKKWKTIGGLDTVRGSQRVESKYNQLQVPQFVHRVNCKTSKITLRVLKAKSDGVTVVRLPGKNDKVLNHRIDYIGTGRRRVRLDVYDVYRQGNAMIREIEAYSHVKKPKEKTD